LCFLDFADLPFVFVFFFPLCVFAFSRFFFQVCWFLE
jgi:hypothetical protein